MSLIAISPDSSQWRCSLLHVDGVFILLDAGLPSGSGDCDIAHLYEPLLPYLPEISFVLLSHSSIQHCGALPWLHARREELGFSFGEIPILCTDPVRQLAELSCIAFLEEHELMMANAENAVDLEDVVQTFLAANHRCLKYGEKFLFRKPAGSGQQRGGGAGGAGGGAAAVTAPGNSEARNPRPPLAANHGRDALGQEDGAATAAGNMAQELEVVPGTGASSRAFGGIHGIAPDVASALATGGEPLLLPLAGGQQLAEAGTTTSAATAASSGMNHQLSAQNSGQHTHPTTTGAQTWAPPPEVSIQAFSSGATIGGSYFFLQFGLQKVVYCVDYDLRATRIVDGLDLENLLTGVGGVNLTRNHIFITAVPPTRKDIPRLGNERSVEHQSLGSTAPRPFGKKGGSGNVKSVCRTCGEEYFLEKTIETLRNGGDVLIPTEGSNSTWTLELLHLLDEAWAVDEALAEKFEICWISPVADVVVEQVRTRMEWVSKKLQEQYHQARRTPFRFPHVKLFASIEEWATREAKKPSAALKSKSNRILLANGSSLETGEAREFFLQLCGGTKNLVWLFGHATLPEQSLASELMFDFIVNKVQNRTYNTKQYIKTRYSEEELRKYYERKCEEEQRREEDLQAKRKRKQDLHTALKREDGEALGGADALPGGAGDVLPQDHFWEDDEGTFSSFQDLGQFVKHKNFAFEFVQARGDDYGQPLSNKEKETWKITHEYESIVAETANAASASGGGGGAGGFSASAAAAARRNDPNFDWMWDLRVRFREPMRIEVQDIQVSVQCVVAYVPLGLRDHRDMRALISSVAPLQLVLLPVQQPDAAEAANTLKLQYEAMSQVSTVVKTFPPLVAGGAASVASMVHFGSGFSRRKRRAQLHEDFFGSLVFSKCPNSARIAFVQAKLVGEQQSGGQNKSFAEEVFEDDSWVIGAKLNAKQAGPQQQRLQLLPRRRDDNSSSSAAAGTGGVGLGAAARTGGGDEDSNLQQNDNQIHLNQNTLLVCPPKLSQFKQTLAEDNKGFLTEFKSQYGKRVLHIDDKAKLSHFSKSDVIKLEGTCCEQFYKARATLYKKSVCI